MIATIDTEEATARITISLNLEAAIAEIGAEHADTDDSPAAARYETLRALPTAELERAFAAFAPRLREGLDIRFDDHPAELSMAGLAIPETEDVGLPRISEVVLAAPIPLGTDTLEWSQHLSLGDAVVRLREPGSPKIRDAVFVRAGDSTGPLALGKTTPRRWTTEALTYLRIGFEHIIPKGLDHILFVVGIFLLAPRFRAILTQVTAFTVAHTVTLALGILGLVSVPAAIVEPLIAASIVWIAIENIRSDRLSRWRPLVVFGFGLLHGLGFASVLSEVGLPEAGFATALISFNLGVELGQLAVIGCCFLLAAGMIRSPSYRVWVARPASLAVACIAVYWVFERVGFGPSL